MNTAESTRKTTLPRFKKPRVLPVSYYGTPSLQEPSVELPEITPELKTFAQAMHLTMEANNGIGLAAPQVGINLRVVTLDLPMPPEEDQRPLSPGEAMLLPLMPMTIINPQILSFAEARETSEEGCLSFPKIYGPVTRPNDVTVKLQMINGDNVQLMCSGLLARCLQHEIDHLNGVVFIERMEEADLEPLKADLNRLYRKTSKRLKRNS
jgi:peptide deformylase